MCSGGESLIFEDEDANTRSVAIVPLAESKQPSGGGGKRLTRKTAHQKPAEDELEQDPCLLCEEAGWDKMWRGMKLHGQCTNACRCHWRLLSLPERIADDAKRKNEPDEWRRMVLPSSGFGERSLPQLG